MDKKITDLSRNDPCHYSNLCPLHILLLTPQKSEIKNKTKIQSVQEELQTQSENTTSEQQKANSVMTIMLTSEAGRIM
jgi:hypothetical protein